MFNYAIVRDVQEPTRAHASDAGVDFFVPRDLTQEILEKKNPLVMKWSFRNGKIIIHPHGRILIPSGIHVLFDPAHALIAFNKSGIASNRGLIVGSCVVDEEYQGEVHLSLINTND
nr:hypothetical protein [Candidatus Sigynarchaeota archaeon]